MSILETVKSQLEQEVCPVHHERPILNWTETSTATSTCCEEFHEYLKNRFYQLAEEAKEQMWQDILKSSPFHR